MVGIGGIGMSSIAEVLLNRGYRVTGSDLEESDTTRRLESMGATIYKGHAAEQVGDADVVVHSSAVDPETNPETQEAERRRISLIPRAEMLGELVRMKFGVGIAGMHGKTTTTTMTGLVATEGAFDPTIIVGGKVETFESNAVAGEGDIIVIEADEYDRTFLRLTPSLAVITNIEEEHLDIYEDLEDIKQAFIQYANSVPFFGAAILCIDDPVVQEIVSDIERRIITYGTTRQAEVRAEDIEHIGLTSRYTAIYRGKELGTVEVNAPGHYNVMNSLAAVAVGVELDIAFEKIKQGIARFTGVRRRFERVGTVNDIQVIDDYSHHPTEIKAMLEAASAGLPDRRIVAVFQPHLYSRTRDFQDEFARSFFNADVLVATDVYPSREEPIEGIDGALIADLAQQYGHREVTYIPDKADLPDYLLDAVRPGDTVITIGAGDIWRYGRAFFEALEAQHEEPEKQPKDVEA